MRKDEDGSESRSHNSGVAGFHSFMHARKVNIPLCRSEFLQDVSIELGRRLKSLKHQHGVLEISVRERGDEYTDQFSVISWGNAGGYVQVVVDDSRRGNYVRRFEREMKGVRAEYIGYAADLSDFDPSEIALLIGKSLGDDPETIAFWKRRDVK